MPFVLYITLASPLLQPSQRTHRPVMTSPERPEDDRLSRLRAEAEAEMRRRLPDQGGPAAKRQKGGGGGGEGAGGEAAAGGRFDYGAVQELSTGLAGVLLTCSLQR